MITESIIALTLIFFISFLIYVFSFLLSPKNKQKNKNQSVYACGEKLFAKKLSINVSLYKFLIFFLVLDASILILAFSSIAINLKNFSFFLIYLSTIFISCLILFVGD